jgi:hypothetical protein
MYCNCTRTEPNTVALSSSENVDEPLKQADTSSDKDELEPAQTNYESEGRRFESCRARPQNPLYSQGVFFLPLGRDFLTLALLTEI